MKTTLDEEEHVGGSSGSTFAPEYYISLSDNIHVCEYH